MLALTRLFDGDAGGKQKMVQGKMVKLAMMVMSDVDPKFKNNNSDSGGDDCGVDPKLRKMVMMVMTAVLIRS